MVVDTISEIKAAMDELEWSGIIARTGEMRWAERSGSRFTLSPNWDTHGPPPGSVSTIIKTGPAD